MPKLNSQIINAAILGFEAQKTRIDDQIAELRAMLSGGSTEPAATPKAPTGKRKISAAARRRMALGQQKRWAAIKGTTESPSQAATPEPPKAKRKLSAAGKAAIVAALKKRWAAKKEAAVKTVPVAKKAITKKAVAKKKLSPARKAVLVANLAKARQAKAAKAAAGPQ